MIAGDWLLIQVTLSEKAAGRMWLRSPRLRFPMPDPIDSGPPAYINALRTIMLPRDTNQYGTVFGGVILSFIDQAGFIEARKHGLHRWVTVAIDRVEFKAPIHVGDVVSLNTRTIATGRSSVTVEVQVRSERYLTGEEVDVTHARMVMVSVDAHGQPVPFSSPPTVGITA